MDFEQQLSQTLHAVAVKTPDHSVEAVLVIGRRRRRNRYLATSSLMLAIMLAGGGWVYSRLANQAETVEVVGAGPGLSPAPTFLPGPISGSIEWSSSNSPVPDLRFGKMVQTDDGTYYLLSTAPGQPSGSIDSESEKRKALYRSSDGLTWEANDSDVEWISILDRRGDTLYALGTAPNVGAGAEVRLGVSDDGGDTWQTQNLLSEEPESVTLQLVEDRVVAQLAVSPKSTLVALRRVEEYNWGSFLSAEIQNDVAYFEATPDGLIVHGVGQFREECALYESPPDGGPSEDDAPATTVGPYDRSCIISWPDLGFDEQPRPDPQTRVLLSENGGEFAKVSVPFVDQEFIQLGESSGRFLIVTYDVSSFPEESGASRHVWLSDDGFVWSEVTLENEVTESAQFGLLGGELYAITHPSGIGAEIWRLDSDGEWQNTGLSSGGENFVSFQSGISERGIYLLIQNLAEITQADEEERGWPLYTVLVTRDGATWFEGQLDAPSGATGIFAGSDEVLVSHQVRLAQDEPAFEDRITVGTFVDSTP